METHSVSFRMQRITVECAYVSVPITPDLVVQRPDGTVGLDVDRMIHLAIELAEVPDVAWQPESCDIQLHPVQQAPE